jgi:hypothetical protein
LAGEEFVPWLACTGELACSPQLPPERDYFFQYTWVMPGPRTQTWDQVVALLRVRARRMVRQHQVRIQVRQIPNALTNIRITTIVCNETEVKVIDPNRIDVIDSVGCKIREVGI